MKYFKCALVIFFPLMFVFLTLTFSTLAFGGIPEDTVMLARIHLADKSQMSEIQGLHLDIAYMKYGQYIDIVTDREEVDYLRSLGYDVEIVHDDLVAFYQSRLAQGKPMGGYHTYGETNAAMDSIHNEHPTITTARINVGTTLEGRTIWAMKISDNPDIDEDEPEVFYNGVIHAREPISIELLLYFMRYLTNNYGTDPRVIYLVNNRELWFVPIMNPDGYEYNRSTDPGGGGMYRKNRRDCGGGNWGVDLNRNWGYMWGYDDEGSSPYCSDETYRGSSAFSEPETQGIRDFINSRQFRMCMDYHSYGMLQLYPWGYDRLYTPDENLFVAVADSMCALNGHTPGTPWEVLYPTNGASIDWEYGEQGTKPKIIAISPEVGNDNDGFWPPLNRILPLCQLELPVNLLCAELADNPYRILPPVSPILLEMDTVESPNYLMRWTFYDTLNPALSFTLVEMTGFERITYNVESEYSDWDLHGFTISTSRSHSSTHSFYSGQGDNLNNRVTGVNSIHVLLNDSLKMWCWYSIETGWDYAYVEISTDGGNTFFSIPGNITTNSNPHGTNLGNGITGSSGGWVQGKFSLTAYAGEDIFLRLRYVTDSYTSNEGLYADDLFPFERFQNQVVLSDAITDTFYQITGKSPGIYYYKVRAKDAQNQIGPWSKVEDVVVVQSFMRGDANRDGEIDASDLVYLLNYLFANGPEPIPFAAGDANNDSQVDIADVIYLLNYLFASGPPPPP
jgi:hypothetical protein